MDSTLLVEYSDSIEYTVFKKESPLPVKVETDNLFLLKYKKKDEKTVNHRKGNREGKRPLSSFKTVFIE